jgi:hypothetical protein
MDQQENPFFSGIYAGYPTFTQTTADRVERVKAFSLEQCQAAQKVPGLQSTVLKAIESRIRKLTKAAAQSGGA